MDKSFLEVAIWVAFFVGILRALAQVLLGDHC
jgi:hypothetical protein